MGAALGGGSRPRACGLIKRYDFARTPKWAVRANDIFEDLSEVFMPFGFTDKFNSITSEDLSLKITQKYAGDKEMLPFYYYDIFSSDNNFVGKISIRIGHNFHSYYNGNVGYEVFSEYRGCGYAYKACQMVLDVASFHEMEYIILACDINNIASCKTIEKPGAELPEICEVPKEYFAWREGMEKQRIYRLDL